MNLDTYYQHCEDAVRCQAASQPLGVYVHLREAAQARDAIIRQAKVRLEFGLIRGVIDYWEGTLTGLAYAERTGKAAICIPLDMYPTEATIYSATLRCIVPVPVDYGAKLPPGQTLVLTGNPES